MRALLFHPRVPSLVALRRRAFSGFATPEYHGAFLPSIAVDSDALRAAAVSAWARKDASTWHTSPVVSLLGGEALQGGTRVDTVDAFGAFAFSERLTISGQKVTQDVIDRSRFGPRW